jgi:SAM-dependent methyltransferase
MAISDGPLDLNSELKQRLREYNYPSAEAFSAEEVIVLTSFLDGAKNPSALLDEEFPDALGQGLLDSETVRSTLSELIEKGLLVPSIESTVTVTGFADPELRELHAGLQSIARITRRIADDLAGLGSPAFQGTPLNVPLAASIAEIRGRIAAIFEQLKPLRHAYVARQLDSLGIDGNTDHLRLNLGPGSKPLPRPWVNIDLSGRGNICMNLLWGLPFKSESVDYVYCSHVLEHIDYRHGALKVLRDWFRVLAPGGCLRLVVPNIKGYLTAYLNNDVEFFASRVRLNPFLSCFLESGLEHVLDYAGAGMRARPGEFFEHKFGFDFETLSALLHRAGFVHVISSRYMESTDPDLRIDDAGTFSHFAFNGIPNSLFVEARK